MQKLIYIKHVMETNTAEICIKDEWDNYTAIPLSHNQLLNILVDGMKIVRLHNKVNVKGEKNDDT
jgi:hypothetical protein